MINELNYYTEIYTFSIKNYDFSTLYLTFEEGEFTEWYYSIRIKYSLKKHIFSKTLEKLIKRLITSECIFIDGWYNKKSTYKELILNLCKIYDNKKLINEFDRNCRKKKK